jgi:hypothetical protein
LAEANEFLRRWSRLKRKSRENAPPPAAEPTQAPATATASEREAPPATAEQPVLPPLESLTKDSDFTPFLRAGVPEALRKEALRRLYASDPVFANLDGLVDYAEDFGALFRAEGAIATAYRVLQGMPGGEEDAEKDPSPPAGHPPTTPAETKAAAASPVPEQPSTPEDAPPAPEPRR